MNTTRLSASNPDVRPLCAESDTPDIWFAQKGTPEAAQAQRICQVCPLVDACRRAAQANHERYGIWGGRLARSTATIGEPVDGVCRRGHDLSLVGRWSAGDTGRRKRCLVCENSRYIQRRNEMRAARSA